MRKIFTLIVCLLVLYQPPNALAQINFPGGRIAISFDGNLHDPDDWGASAMALAMLEAANLSNKVAHVDFNNHLGQTEAGWEREMIESCMGGAQRFGYNPAVFFDNQKELNASINSLASAINASTANNPLWILAAGPMEIVWRGINSANEGKRKYVRVVSHSSWNENHNKSSHGGSGPLQHNWKDLTNDFQGDGVIFYRINDQNGQLNTARDKWFWLRDSNKENWRWLYGRDGFSDKFDVSDAGMAYWLLSGGPNGGRENCGWQETKALLAGAATSPPSEDPADNTDCAFTEKNGIVVIEAESGSGSGWSKKSSISGYTGSGYLEWTGSDQFNSPGIGTISYKIYIGKSGTYQFQWRNRIVIGSNTTEHNDSWLRFPDASNFFAKDGSSIVYPKGSGKSPNPEGAGSNGWFKIYTGKTGWNWQTTTYDNNLHNIYVTFDSPGVYTLQISGRSKGHAIDRMVLSHSSVSSSTAQNTGLAETTCEGTTANAAPKVSVGSDKTLTLPTNSVSLTATASDTDGSIASYAWSKVSGPSASLSGASSKTLTASNLVAGSYTFKVTVKDDDGASATDQIVVTVKVGASEPDPGSTTNAIPGKVEAEDYSSMSGIQTESTTDAGGGENIGYIKNGDFTDYKVNVGSAGTYEVKFRVASNTSGGSINLKKGSTSLGSVKVANTGGWQSWKTVSTEVNLSSGTQTLRLAFSGGSGYLLNVNHIDFVKASGGGSEPVTSTSSLSPIHDAYLDNGSRYNNTELRSELDKRTTYLSFDLSGISGEISNARLQLTVGSDPGDGTITVARGSHSNWTEDNLSNSNKPSENEILSSIDATFSSGKTYTFALGSITAGGKLTLVVSHPSGNDVAFASKENSNSSDRPKLIITTVTNARMASKSKGGLEEELLSEEGEIMTTVSVYPNPASEYVQVGASAESSYSLMSRSGQTLQTGTVGETGLIDVRQLEEGIYILHLVSEGSTTFHKLLIRY